jgi:hypothetical protein
VDVNSLILRQGMRAGVNESLPALPFARWHPAAQVTEFASWHKPKFTDFGIATALLLGAG